MRNKSNDHDNEPLVNEVLADEGWSAFDSRLRTDALKTFVVARRQRQVRRMAAQAVACVLAVGFGVWFLAPRPAPPTATQNTTAVGSTHQRQPGGLRSAITEQQMLAMFPEGSCIVAEINGEKKLVFLNPKTAREGFPVARNE